MNDRYLYRAKRIDNDEWTYGYLYGIWEKAMMVGHGDYQRIQLNECIKERCVAYCEEDGKCHKYMNEVEN